MGKPNNTVTIKGRLWKRPELKKLDSGLRLCNFHVIVDDSIFDEKTGEFANVSQLVPVTASAAVAAKHGFNPLTSAKNLKGKAGEKFGAESAAMSAAAKGVGGAAGAVGAAAVQGIKTVQDKITRLRELGQ